jgi:hypothetical protein
MYNLAMAFLGAARVSVVFIACFCLSPGFVDTKSSAGSGAKVTLAEGAKSIRHCLFEAPKERKWLVFWIQWGTQPSSSLEKS